MSREIEQFPADQPLKSLHWILREVDREILKILKKFEASSDPKRRLPRVGERVVGGSIDGAACRAPVDAEVLQDARNDVVERKGDRRVVRKLAISDTEALQGIHEPLRDPERVVRLAIVEEDARDLLL